MAGQIVARADRTWVVRVYVGRTTDGRRKYVNRTVHGPKKEAQQVLNAMLREKDTGGIVQPSRNSLDEHLNHWLETAARPRVRTRTFEDYKSIADRYIRPQLGSMALAQIQPRDVQRLYTRLIDSGLSAQTVRHVHSVLNNAIKQAVRWRLVGTNPCEHVDLPKVRRQEMQALSRQQAERLLCAAKGTKWEVLFTLLLTTGLRPSEALALRWGDLDLEGGTLTVVRTLTGKPGAWRFEEPKTSRSRRRVPLPSSVVTFLRDFRQAQFGRDESIVANLALVFSTEAGGPLDLRNLVNRHFKPLLRRAGLPASVRLYDLRHTCATLLLAADVNPKIVSERLGHASITLTLDTYSHVLPDMQQSAAVRLEELLFARA